MKKILLLLPLLLFSCNFEYSNQYDFRNELRDKHPYSEIVEIEEFSGWAWYRVNDTIKGETWIYKGARTKSEVERYKL
jgi:hypothetical protein